ncbi:XRE family transcriptional regulator [Glaciihabitans arcticus]|uniref:XRE family transcriptional regulator n=1 Tax=Glaciihabitans arcticus TaxID=2668039 RepID=A0A4Q9GP46_9MICO|nr:helix-turn-helix transcriptional regulator [Glaciihabitans arcticus]TBN56511.1 XRE family transcriptional regulator [Glaciihabitans arcticus]
MAEIIPLRPVRTPEPLWRELVGESLRARRLAAGKTLAETAARAGISPQYLSEIERGLKEPSSEMIAAVLGALGTTLVDLTTDVAEQLAPSRSETMLLAA